MLTTNFVPKKHFLFRFSALSALLLCALITFSIHNNVQAKSSGIYTVKDVKVDVTAKSAVQARELAFKKAQRKAFIKLLHRIVSGEDISQFEEFDDQYIGSLVKDFEITSEKASNVRYIGTYTFRFDQRSIQTLLNNNNLAYTDVSSKPILVLPFYHNGSQTVIWDQDNPWMNAWNKQDSFQGLVPVVVPVGDLMDPADIQNNQALSYNPESLRSMVSRHGSGEALVVLALPQFKSGGTKPDTLDIMMYRTDRNTPELASKISVSTSDIRKGNDIFSEAVIRTQEKLQKDWKKRTTTSSAQSNNLKVRVNFKTMRQWIETHQALKKVQGVHTIKVLSLTPRNAIITLSFNGSESRLRLALAQSDITLSEPKISFADAGGSPLEYELHLNKYKIVH